MDCRTTREAVSAELDGEDHGADPRLLDRHLASCPGCRSWRADAIRLDKLGRLAPAREPGPDLAGAVLARTRLPRRDGRGVTLRAALVAVALAQLVVGAASLFLPLGLHTGMAVSVHMDHEEAAFNLAFGVALLVVACRPRSASAQLPVLGSFVLVLAAASAFDLTDGHVTWSRLATHLPIVAGLALSALLARRARPGSGPVDAAAPVAERAERGYPADPWGDAPPADPGDRYDGPCPPAAHRESA